ncbi:hypothetical protein T459_11739 [Capsicum annuum]|uniref:Uncharacterized protein n=1 Tax=Capsicum annuum TaxID=4072 RepID=A0A2G2ZMT0_CAPAN|nr:hypothetical protein T459_11739 [Capsicum annuum]
MIYFTGRSLGQVQDGPAVPGKRIEEASDYFMHAPLGSGGYSSVLMLNIRTTPSMISSHNSSNSFGESSSCEKTIDMAHMGFMDQDESWNLFKSAAFTNEALPYEFESVGNKIAEKCHGLPLTIIAVAGLLKSKRIIEDWESIAKDVKSFVTSDSNEKCSHVLGLSYNHLTIDLKKCLLHF